MGNKDKNKNDNFWRDLPRPFFCLAPMADVTDAAFRNIIAKYSRHGESGGGPDVFWTEFVSADGLMSEGREVLKVDFQYSEREHPIVAQIFGSNLENMRGAAKLCATLGFDGIDINMGCPDRSIEKQGAGASHMKDPDHAVLVIRAVKEGIKDSGRNIPVSVKTRIGYNKNSINEWIPKLLGEGLGALTIHARTRKEMSLVPARWEHVREVVEIRDKMGVDTLIIGNGDLKDLDDAREKVGASHADGAMLGRAIFGNPWLFDLNKKSISIEEKLHVMMEHTELFERELGKVKNFAIMKKHYKAYVNGFDGAKELRVKLMDEAKDASGVKDIVENFLAEHTNLL